MTLKEMEAALEADWENVVAFFHGIFHKAEAVKEAAPASVSVEVPVAEPVPVAPEAVKVAPVNTTDATAPNFHAPAEPAPVQPAPPAADTPDFVNGASFDFKWQGANIIFTGKQTKTITGASGKVLVETNDRPNTKPYTLTVNGVSKAQEMVEAICSVSLDVEGDITVSVDQPEDSSVVMNFHKVG